MATELSWTESALQDLQGIVAYIAKDSPHYAALTAERILAAAARVSEFPESGRVVPEFGTPELREVFWHGYRIVYRVAAQTTAILAVAHGARRLEEHWKGG